MTFDVLERPLALASIVKLWARRRNINDSTQDTLSSYAYTLMVVFFLQQRGVLPNLQAPGLLRAYEEWRGALLPAVEVNGFELRYCADDDFLAALAKVSFWSASDTPRHAERAGQELAATGALRCCRCCAPRPRGPRRRSLRRC